jgi:IS30 family transposase
VSGDTGRNLDRQEGAAAMTYHQLTQDERYRIAALSAAGWSQRAIAEALGRAPSTISRERRRNATRHDGKYRAEKAHQYAVARLRRCRRGSQFDAKTYRLIDSGIRRCWSPEQIVGFYSQLEVGMPSLETIYRRLRRDKKVGGPLHRFARHMSKFGRKRYRSPATRGVVSGKPHISERPKEVEGREEPGHWEGDTVMGAGTSHCLLTLVERSTGFAVIKLLGARNKAETNSALRRAICARRADFKTITFDNGTEFHDYVEIVERTGVQCYFATPYHSWERGSNENLNGLIRQYLPKGSSLKGLTQSDCDWIARQLNNRPRKRYQFRTPAQMLRVRSGVALAS